MTFVIACYSHMTQKNKAGNFSCEFEIHYLRVDRHLFRFDVLWADRLCWLRHLPNHHLSSQTAEVEILNRVKETLFQLRNTRFQDSQFLISGDFNLFLFLLSLSFIFVVLARFSAYPPSSAHFLTLVFRNGNFGTTYVAVEINRGQDTSARGASSKLRNYGDNIF